MSNDNDKQQDILARILDSDDYYYNSSSDGEAYDFEEYRPVWRPSSPTYCPTSPSSPKVGGKREREESTDEDSEDFEEEDFSVLEKRPRQQLPTFETHFLFVLGQLLWVTKGIREHLGKNRCDNADYKIKVDKEINYKEEYKNVKSLPTCLWSIVNK